MSRHLGVLLAALVASAPGLTAPKPELREITAAETITIRPDRAYLLIRLWRPAGVASVEPVLLRVPEKSELDEFSSAKQAAFAAAEPELRRAHENALRKRREAEAAGRRFKGTIPPRPSLESFNFVYDGASNVSNVHNGRPLVPGRPESVYLLEGLPGPYIVYGAAYGSSMMLDWLNLCFCLGTVGFDARPGEITDLGTFYGDLAKKRSIIPELAQESGYGPSSDTPLVLLTGTVRPAGEGAVAPRVLAGQRIVAANYRAIGKFIEPNAQGINRMVPVPGVLGYDNGRVIDIKTGRPVDDQF